MWWVSENHDLIYSAKYPRFNKEVYDKNVHLGISFISKAW